MALVLFITTLGSLLVTVVALLGLLGKLPPNTFAGIRTSYTRSSEEAWYRAHREAAPVMIFGGVAATAAGLAFLPFALAGEVEDGVMLAVVIAQVAILLFSVLFSATWGISRAKRAL